MRGNVAGIPLKELIASPAVLDGFLAGFHVSFVDTITGL